MPYDLFWHGPISAYLQYRAAYLKRQDEQQESKNCIAWLHGAYMTRAIAACMPNSKVTYPEQPIVSLTPEQEEKRQQTEDMIAQHNEQMRKIQERQALEFQQGLMEANSYGRADH